MSVIRKELGVFVALAALPAALPVASPAASATAAPAKQCSTRLLSPAEMARGVKSEVKCYLTRDEMLAASGVRSLLADQPLATHYINTNGSGQYLTIVGSSCEGGGVNLSGTFNDSISSTRNLLCGRVKHFADANGNGDYQITSGGLVNMNGTMNDRTTSTYYYAS